MTTLLEEFEVSLGKLMRQMDKNPETSLSDRMKVYDRVLKLGQIKLKIVDDDETSGFIDD